MYVLFGKVIGTITEPGLHFLPSTFGLNAFIVNFFGQCHVLDLRLDQEYRRSEAVNSEEGAPMGVASGMNVDQRSGRLPVQEYRSPGFAACQCQQRHCSLSEQHAACGNASNAA